MKEPIRVFVFYDLDIPEDAGMGLCPFCMTENRFGIERESGKYRCVKCEESGNAYTFIARLHEVSFDQTPETAYEEFAQERNLSVQTLLDWGLCQSIISGDWLMPIYNSEDKIANLYKLVKNLETGKYTAMSGPELKLHPLRPLHQSKTQKTVHVAEGWSDSLALYDALACIRLNGGRLVRTGNRETSLLATEAVIGIPGATSFQASWLEHLHDKDARLYFDNDHPKKIKSSGKVVQASWQGVQKIHALANQNGHSPKSLQVLLWGEERKAIPNDFGQPTISYNPEQPSGYDLRDLIREVGPIRGYQFLLDRTKTLPPEVLSNILSKEAAAPAIQPVECHSFEQLMTIFESSGYHVTQNIRDTFAVVLATVVSTQVGGDAKLWFRIIGPPGCISGDTRVTYNRGGISREIFVDELFKGVNGGKRNDRGARKWSPFIETTIQCRIEDGSTRSKRLLGVVYSGKKPVYRVNTENGYSIKATADHRFLTDRGWLPLRSLTVEDCLYTIAKVATGKKKPKTSYTERCSLYNHPFAVKKEPRYKDKGSHRVVLHRLVVEANLNGLELAEYLRILRTDPIASKGLVFLRPDQLVHHKDENTKNNALDNLQITDSVEHGKIHGNGYNFQPKTKLAKIQSIEYVGIEDTYDLQMDDPHNFLANGIVVHNSSKTSIAEAVSAAKEYVFPTSLVTGFHSGFVGDGSARSRKEDSSLIPIMNQKTVIIKDADTLINAPGRDRILGELRDIYDGVSRANYRNRKKSSYANLKISFLLCGTGNLRALNRSFLGERFLDCEIYGGEDVTPYIDKAFAAEYAAIMQTFDHTGASEPADQQLQASTYGFIKYLKETTVPAPAMLEESANALKSLASVLAYLRAKAVRDHEESLAYRPEKEIPTRIIKQIVKLSCSLALVLGKSAIDAEVVRLVRKIVSDTAKGFHSEVIEACIQRPYTVKQLALKLNTSESGVQRLLKDMREFSMIEHASEPNLSGVGGRHTHVFRLTPTFEALYRAAFGIAKPKPKVAARPKPVVK